jgi:4-hydroxybenzoate polyprenyltransferase
MHLSKLVRADFGSDLKVQPEYNFKERLTGFLELVRPVFLVMTPLNAASAAVLSIRGIPSWNLCLIGFITGALAAAGVNTFNKYTDNQRDKIMWPSRSIPSGRVKPWQALALSCLCYSISLILCWIFFNPTAFGLLLAAEVLGSLYSAYLRDRVGYLSLPLIEGLIFLCGWACLSPGTLLTPLPWYLYFLGVIWQSSHILAHYILNIRYDEAGKPVIRTPALFARPLPEAAAAASLVLAIVLFLMCLILPFFTSLSYLYIISVVLCGAYTLFQCGAFAKSTRDTSKLHKAWSSLSLFRMVISLAILFSVLIYP